MSHAFRALLCLALAGSLAACTPENATDSAAANRAVEGPVAGTINGEPVPQALIDAYANARYQKDMAELSPEQLEQSRQDFVRLYALSQAARKEGLENDPALAMQTLQALAQTYVRTRVESDSFSDDDVRARYESLLNSGEARELKARHILLESEEGARAVIAELDGGADFAELAKTKSTGPSATNGGDLGWFGSGSMVEPFWQGALALEAGSYTQDPVQTRFGWHVILVEQTRDRPFAQAEQQLKSQMQREYVDELVNGITDSATVSWASGE